jgi:hypothetical protein
MKSIRTVRLLALVVVVWLTLALAACGGGTTAQQFAPQTPTPTPTPPATPSTPATTLAISTADLPIATMQQPYSANLAATGSTGAVKWTVLSGALPAGVTLASDTGALSGSPTASGIFNVSIQAADTVSSVTRSFAMHVSGNGMWYHQYAKPGTYNVRVTTTDAQGNVASTNQTVVVK